MDSASNLRSQPDLCRRIAQLFDEDDGRSGVLVLLTEPWPGTILRTRLAHARKA